MPNDITVSRVAGPAPGGAASQPTPAPPAQASVSTPARPFPNPTLRLDPTLGMVVIEFRDASGTVKNSIPTQQQLDAYRAAERTHSGHPGDGRDPAAPARAGPPAGAGAPEARATETRAAETRAGEARGAETRAADAPPADRPPPATRQA